MHPYINRPAKAALRWYTSQEQLTRNTVACREASELCPFALHWPSWQILPFQFAVFETSFSAASWEVYDLAGTLVADLSIHIPALVVDGIVAPGPERMVVTNSAPILLETFVAGGLYEMRITSAAGKTYYSETIRVHCGICGVADGIYGDDALVEGNVYLYTDGRLATYCGEECDEPVDANGFNTFVNCPEGNALVVSLSKWGEYRWLNGEWVAVNEMRCFHKLEWTNCGDVGTGIYKDNGFSNIVYLKEEDAPLGLPVISFNEGREKDVNGDEYVSSARKDVEWSLSTQMPWYLLDAITETPMMGDVRLRVANGEGVDQLENIRFEIEWDGACMATIAMAFRLSDYTASTGCCDEYERAAFVCANVPGSFSFRTEGPWNEEDQLAIEDDQPEDDSYFTVRDPLGGLHFVSPEDIAIIFPGPEVPTGDWCVWKSDADGNPVESVWGDLGISGGIGANKILDLDLSRVDEVSVRLVLSGITFDTAFDATVFPGLPTLEVISSTMPDPPIVDGMVNLVKLVVRDCGLTERPDIAGCIVLANVDCRYNALPADQVDALCIAVEALGLSSGYLALDGGTNAAPTAASLAARTALLGRGYTLSFN